MSLLLVLLGCAAISIPRMEAMSTVPECSTPASISMMRGFPVAFLTYVGERGLCELRISTNIPRSSRNVFYSTKDCIETCCPESCRPACCNGYFKK